MRKSTWTPSIVPSGADETVYLGRWFRSARPRLARGRLRNYRSWDSHSGLAERAIQQPRTRHCLQHGRAMVGRRFRGRCPRTAPALRSTDVRPTLLALRFRWATWFRRSTTI